MNRTSMLITALTGLVALPALGQPLPTADRAVSALLFDLDPAGGAAVDYFLKIGSVEGESTSADLSVVLELRVNGATVSSTTIGIGQTPAGNCSGLGCAPDEPCICTEPPGVVCECGPIVVISGSIPAPAQVGDEIMVILYPAPMAVPDPDASNDALTTTFELGRFWNRRIDDVSVVPAAGGGDSFFDVFVDVGFEAHYVGGLDLSTVAEVLVNGVVVAQSEPLSRLIAYDDCSCGFGCAPAWNGICGLSDISGDCACDVTGGIVVPAVPADPGNEIMVILRPAPGALPELPGLEGDDQHGADVPSGCSADLDGSGIVDFNDLLQLLATWGACAGCPADLDHDDAVGFSDLLQLLAAWGPCFPT